MNFKELLPGDLILFKLNNELFHVAIFSPEADRTSDIIDATSNKGVARGTLEGLYNVLHGCTRTGNLFGLFSNNLTIDVVRSKTLDGQKIADQAEFWRLHRVSYDVNSLANIVETTWHPSFTISDEDEEKNIRKYWKYATRRHSAMIDHPIEPGIFSVICSFFLAPIWNLPRCFVNFFVQLIQYINQKTEQDTSEKGVNCAGFVLSVVAAVALDDKSLPDVLECRRKLGGITRINPDRYSLDAVMNNVFSDTQRFENKGTLDLGILSNKPFNKKILHDERLQDSIAQRCLTFA